MTYPLSKDFRIAFEDLRVVARGLVRPECVIALSSGDLLAANGGGGYSRIVAETGRVNHVIAMHQSRKFLPNGIALAPDGRVHFADLGGSTDGGLFAIDAAGGIEAVLEAVEGERLPPSNFVTIDAEGTTWFTVSTRRRPRSLAWNHRVADGYIGVIDQRGARIVADNLAFANEVAFSPDGRWVYVNETYGQRVSRYPLRPGATLGEKEVVAQLGGADLPDGITFDEHGGAWITCIASNRLLLVRPDGEVQVILEDSDPLHVARVVEGIRTSSMPHEVMQTAGRSRLANISSLAFGGQHRRTAYLGCLLDDALRAFDSPVAGALTPHWPRRLTG
jgi:sugar lactone lactonase YvrE